MYYRMLKLIKTTSIKVGSRGVLVTPGALEHARLGATRDFGQMEFFGMLAGWVSLKSILSNSTCP